MKRILLIGYVLLAAMLTQSFAQERRVTGTVTSHSDGSTMPGVQVVVKGTTIGTVTDINGKYELNVPAGSTLVFQFVGMNTEEVAVGDKTIVNVVLLQDIATLQEVVVTALGIRREAKALGYSVQSVGGDEIAKAATLHPINALSGRTSGVNITNSSGAAGASTYITIRGNASITGNNQPLFIVDGVPIDNSQVTSGNPDDGSNNLLSGVALSNRSIDINPEDIETINILKGGAATALYGLRAANGAVVITTKKGVSGRKNFSVNLVASMGIEQVSQLPGMQNKYGQGTFGRLLTNGTMNPTTLVWGPRLDTLRFTGTDNNFYYPQGNIVAQSNPNAKADLKVPANNPYDQFFRTGISHNTNLSISGGRENTSYFFSVGNSQNNGIIPLNEFRRTNVTLAGETKLSDKFSTEARIAYTNSGGIRIQQGSNVSGIMLALLRMPPNFDITGGSNDPANDPAAYQLEFGQQRNAYNGGGYDNPFWSVNKNQFKDDVHRITGYAAINYNALDWLRFTYRVGNDFYSDRRKQFFERGSRSAPSGRLYEEQLFVREFNSDFMLNVNRKLTDDISMTALLGQNLYQSYFQNLFTQGDNLSMLGFYHMSNAVSIMTREEQSGKRTAAFYGDLGFAYKSLFFVNFTGRQEWSTTLPKENNSFFYPSVSGSFIFTELPVLADNPFLSFGKLRASYAQIANDAFAYATEGVYVSSAWGDGWTDGVAFPAWGTTAFNISTRLPNNELKPEKLSSFEFGIDLRFFGNRIGLDMAYYSNLNEDLILAVPVARSSGLYTKVMNAASMVNKGIEVSLLTTPVKTTDFSWNLDVNFTKNINEVLSLAEGVENVTLAGFVGAQARAVVGESYGSIFGDYWVKHDNGKRLIDSDPESSTYGFPMMADGETKLGNVLPNWTMGINNSFSYKGLTLGFLFDIKNGGVMWNGTKGAMYYFGTHKDTESREATDQFVFEGVKADGTPNDIKVNKDIYWYVLGEGSGFTGPTEEFIEKTDWVRLRELSLSYKLSKNLLGSSLFNGVEIFATGRNLWLSTPYTGVDPETSLIGAGNGQGLDYFNMPGTKSYTFGVRVNL